MFHTNKMPKIIVFRVVIEGTAPTEGPPTACHGKRPSCPKHLSACLLIQPRTRAPASSFPTCESHFQAHICARLSSHGKRPSCPEHPERPPSHPAPNARASSSSFHTCESHFRAHICAHLQFQAAPPMSRLQLQAACLCQPAWSACVSP